MKSSPKSVSHTSLYSVPLVAENAARLFREMLASVHCLRYQSVNCSVLLELACLYSCALHSW